MRDRQNKQGLYLVAYSSRHWTVREYLCVIYKTLHLFTFPFWCIFNPERRVCVCFLLALMVYSTVFFLAIITFFVFSWFFFSVSYIYASGTLNGNHKIIMRDIFVYWICSMICVGLDRTRTRKRKKGKSKGNFVVFSI